MNNGKIPCPVCGTPMNHHADKMVYACEDGGPLNSAGEVLEEFHRCPTCGAGIARRAGLIAGLE